MLSFRAWWLGQQDHHVRALGEKKLGLSHEGLSFVVLLLLVHAAEQGAARYGGLWAHCFADMLIGIAGRNARRRPCRITWLVIGHGFSAHDRERHVNSRGRNILGDEDIPWLVGATWRALAMLSFQTALRMPQHGSLIARAVS